MLASASLQSISQAKASTADAASATSLPLDIIIEALFSTALLVVGVVLGSPALRPIQWATWAGEAEKDTRRPKGRKRFEGDGGTEGVSMAWLEDRRGFWDVRVRFVTSVHLLGCVISQRLISSQTKRKEFADWVRKGGEKEMVSR